MLFVEQKWYKTINKTIDRFCFLLLYFTAIKL